MMGHILNAIFPGYIKATQSTKYIYDITDAQDLYMLSEV